MRRWSLSFPEIVIGLCSVFRSVVIRGPSWPPAGMFKWFHCSPVLDGFTVVSWPVVMETHCHIPPGALTIEALFLRKSVTSGSRSPRVCLRTDESEQDSPTCLNKQIPLQCIQEKCHNLDSASTSNTSFLCQLKEQREVCWVIDHSRASGARDEANDLKKDSRIYQIKVILGQLVFFLGLFKSK